MAIPTTGNISIKEFSGSDRSIDTAMTSTSSGSLSALSAASIGWQGGRSQVATNDTDDSPYSMLEFSGYSHITTDAWPYVTVPSSANGSAQPVTSLTYGHPWGSEYHLIVNAPIESQAFCAMKFTRTDVDSNSGYVTIDSWSGTANAMATHYIAQWDYSGIDSRAITVKYTSVNGSSGSGNTNSQPADDGYNSGTWYSLQNGSSNSVQFYWHAARAGNGPDGLSLSYAVNTSFFINLYDQDNWGDSGVNYRVESANITSISVMARRGMEP